MVAAALLSLSRANEYFHGFKDLIGSSQVFVQEMIGVDLEEPVISFVLVQVPVPLLLSLGYGFYVLSPFFIFFVGLAGAGRLSASWFGNFRGGRK